MSLHRNLKPILLATALLISSVLGIGIGVLGWEGSTPIMGLIAIAVLWLLFNKPEVGLKLLIATTFVIILLGQDQSIELFDLQVRLASLLKDLLFSLVLLTWALQVALGRITLKIDGLTIVVILFMLWSLFRGITSPNGYVAGLLGVRSTIQYAFLFLVAGTAIRSYKQAQSLLWILILSSLYPAIAGVFQVETVISGLAETETGEVVKLTNQRLYFMASVHGVNVFAGYIGIVLSSVMAISLFDKVGALKRAFLLAYGVLLSIILYLTFSRRLWIAFAIVMLVFLILKRVRPSTILIVGLLVTGLLLLNQTPLELAAARMGLYTGYWIRDVISYTRVEEWQYLWDGVSQSITSFLFGTGLGTAGAVEEALNLSEGVSGHNYYLVVLYQLGLAGLFLFLTILVLGILKAWKLWKKTKLPLVRQIIASVLGSMLIVMLSALVGISFENYPLNLIFWLFLGILQACDWLAKQEELAIV